MGSETELKLTLTTALQAAVLRELRRLGRGTTLVLDNTYYDTADLLLLRHGMALRIRRSGHQTVQTLKTRGAEGALSTRGEWETPAPRGRPDLRRLAGTPLAQLLGRHPRARLQPRFTTRFGRRTWSVDLGGARIEAALDSGWIEAKRNAPRAAVRSRGNAPPADAPARNAREPLHELELELLQGSAADLLAFALRLQRAIPGRDGLVPYSDSKATRGYRRATGKPRTPVKANAAAFAAALPAAARDAELGTLARALTARGTELLLANTSGDPPLEDPEFVHQARVAMRRLRSVLRLLRDDVAVPKRCADALRWIAGELGRVRDLDVLASATLPALESSLRQARALDPSSTLALQRASARLQRRRDRAIERLRALLRSRRYALAVLRLLRWAAEPHAARPLLRTLGDIALPLLKSMHRRLARDAQRFVSMSPSRQHRVRIRIKRLRYALDLCAAVLPMDARILPLVENLQDTLGELNDVAVLDETLPRLTTSARLRELAKAQRRAATAALVERAQGQLVQLVDAPWPWMAGARRAKP